jgi:hypothetical protein
MISKLDANDRAFARLRGADPAFAAPPSEVDPAMLADVLRSPIGDSVPPRRRARLIALGGLAAAIAAGVAVVVPTLWTNGQSASAAYAVSSTADGSLEVTVHWNELHDPAALNIELDRLGARTVVMVPSGPGQCTADVWADPAHSTLRIDFTAHPELNDPHKLREYLAALTPWIETGGVPGDGSDVAVFTIHPDAIPDGDQLLITAGFSDHDLAVRPLLVTVVPPCVPAVSDSVYTSTGIHPR